MTSGFAGATFDWITEPSSCSLPNVFKKLRLQTKEDVKTRNALRPNNSPCHLAARASGCARSRNCSEQRPDAGSHRHGERTPERDAHCTYRYSRATRACGQPAEQRRNNSEVPETRGIKP